LLLKRGRDCCGLLVGELLLELGDALGRTVQELADVGVVFTNREAVEGIVTVGASLEESLLSDERHVERLVGRLRGNVLDYERILRFNFTFS
jgi:hypothetical protein